MVLRLDKSLMEQEVARACEGPGVWFVRWDRREFTAVYRDDETEEILGRYATFEEAHKAASRAADEAFLEFVETWKDPDWWIVF